MEALGSFRRGKVIAPGRIPPDIADAVRADPGGRFTIISQEPGNRWREGGAWWPDVNSAFEAALRSSTAFPRITYHVVRVGE